MKKIEGAHRDDATEISQEDIEESRHGGQSEALVEHSQAGGKVQRRASIEKHCVQLQIKPFKKDSDVQRILIGKPTDRGNKTMMRDRKTLPWKI